jgi:valyl-tRNA synthetase
MLGDTGVAVNPEDERYKHMIGKNVILPVVGRAIPVVADEYVDMTFGTGAVKMTPAHDPNDFEVAQRTGLPMLRVLTDDGHINENGGKFCGMDRFECRKAIVKDLEKSGALIKIEPYAHAVGTCYRCHTTVEPLVSKQWFVDMKPLAKAAIAAVRDGRIRFVPERFERTYFNWMENIRDWCISRQLWWGHRIPAYYCDNCGEIVVAKEMPKVCPKCGYKHFHQDEDVLDTWFSSGMWPFSTLGYPDQTPDLGYFYPTSTLVTGYDIIFFWVARMIVFGLEVMNEIPFDTVYVHGIVRDSQGRKMSKSLGNGIDPLEVIEKHGADALRFSLIAGNSPGNDMRFYWEKVEAAGNFCNKIYNASRFVLMNLDDDITGEIDPGSLDMADKWLLTRLNAVIGEVTAAMDEYELGIAVQKLYDFVWSEFCDWYIELTKTSLYGEDAGKKRAVQQVLMAALTDILKLLHPFMPFITEELYSYLHPGAETIMLEAGPKARALDYPAEADAMQAIMDAIRAVRNVRAEMNVPPSKRTHMTLVAKPADVDALESTKVYLTRLAGASDVRVQTDKANIPSDAVSVISHIAEIFIPLGDLVDVGAELERIAKEKEHLLSEIARAEGN